jgi:hypothetical protein
MRLKESQIPTSICQRLSEEGMSEWMDDDPSMTFHEPNAKEQRRKMMTFDFLILEMKGNKCDEYDLSDDLRWDEDH